MSNVELRAFEARQPSDFEGVFAAIADQQIGALVSSRRHHVEGKRQRTCRLCRGEEAPLVWVPGIRAVQEASFSRNSSCSPFIALAVS